MVIDGLLVISAMVLNSLISGDAGFRASASTFQTKKRPLFGAVSFLYHSLARLTKDSNSSFDFSFDAYQFSHLLCI